MTNETHVERSTTPPRRVNRMVAFTQAIMIPLLIAAGWFLHGLLPSAPAGGPGGPMGGPSGPPAVMVAVVAEGPTESPEEYMGRVEAVETVHIMPQVAGYLATVHFTEGSVVSSGDLLFTIERGPFEARVAVAQAAVQQAEANLPAAQADLESATANRVRAEKYLERLKSANERSVVQADIDTASADFEQAVAQVKQRAAAVQQAQAAIEQAKANARLAEIDLGYTEIRSPISGRIGTALVTVGNYVTPASGPLALIVQTDPIRVVYSVSDREYTELLTARGEEGKMRVDMQLRLPDGTVYPKPGEWSYADNQMDPGTGTIALRANFDNPDGLLVPMTHVTVLSQATDMRTALLIPSQAVMIDQSGESVYVVNAEGIAEKRPVALGPEVDGHRTVESGLNAGEQVIVEGIQKAQPGQPVEATVAATGPKGN